MERESNSDSRALHEDICSKELIDATELLGRSHGDGTELEEYEAAPHHRTAHSASGAMRRFS